MKKIISISVILTTLPVLIVSFDSYGQGANTCMCPCTCPPESGPSSQYQAPPPPPPPSQSYSSQQSYTNSTSTKDEDRHVNTPSPQPAGQVEGYSHGYSDLPTEWAEPVQLPPGSVRVEDLPENYRVAGTAPNQPGYSSDQSDNSGNSEPVYPQPVNQQPANEQVYSTGGEIEEIDASPPPARWGN